MLWGTNLISKLLRYLGEGSGVDNAWVNRIMCDLKLHSAAAINISSYFVQLIIGSLSSPMITNLQQRGRVNPEESPGANFTLSGAIIGVLHEPHIASNQIVKFPRI